MRNMLPRWLSIVGFHENPRDSCFSLYILYQTKTSYQMFNKYLVEFLGTCFFVFVILATGNPLAIGAGLALAILLTKDISGGHINPAVSVVMASLGKLPVQELVPYVLAQVFGALVALEVFKRTMA